MSPALAEPVSIDRTSSKVIDPIEFQKWLWPDITFYDKQREIIYSVMDDDSTFVPAGNMLGKDFVAGFLIVWYFCSRRPCRIVTTSSKDAHLDVLWGELHNFVQTAKHPLAESEGGPLRITHRDIRWINTNGDKCPLSYIVGQVANDQTMAAMQGHHIKQTGDRIPRTLFVCDEASGVPDGYWPMIDSWANRRLILGNTWYCQNFFYYAIKGKPGTDDVGGDILRPNGKGFYRKIIHIRATDSPNVRYAQWEIDQGREPSGAIVIPGVKPWEEYQRNLRMWDKIQKCVSLDAEFYEGAEVKFFPADWLNVAKVKAKMYEGRKRRAKGVGVDPAEGGDKCMMAAVDDLGVIAMEEIVLPMIEIHGERVANTAVIPNEVLRFAAVHGCEVQNIMFDAGGGGTGHANRMREQGYKVRTVSFGEAASEFDRFTRRLRSKPERIEISETKYAYKNRRSEMYGTLRQFLDPANETEFGIGAEFNELLRQMAVVPLTYDEEGRLDLLKKRKKDPDSDEITLTELIGHSPDEMDAVAIAVFAMVYKAAKVVAGGAW